MANGSGPHGRGRARFAAVGRSRLHGPRGDGAARPHPRRGAEARRSRRPSRAVSAPARRRSPARSSALLAGDPELEVPSPTFTLMQTYDTPARPDRPRRSLSPRRRRRTRGARLGRDAPRAPSPSSNGPSGRTAALKPDRLDIALDLAPGRNPKRGSRPSPATGALRRRASQRLAAFQALVEAQPAGTRRGAHPMPGRRLDARLRAAGEAVGRDRDPDDLAAAAGRAAGAPRQALQRPSPSSPRASMPSWRSTAACARSASARRRSTARISRPASCSSRISAPSPSSTRTGPIPERYAEATRAPRAAPRRDACRRSCRSPDGRDHVLPPYDLEALLIEVELLPTGTCRTSCGTQLSGSARAEFVTSGPSPDGDRRRSRRPGRCATIIRRT